MDLTQPDSDDGENGEEALHLTKNVESKIVNDIDNVVKPSIERDQGNITFS